AVWDMARRLCPDHRRAAIALASLALLSLLTTVYAQLIAIAAGALLGLALCRTKSTGDTRAELRHAAAFPVSRKAGIAALIVFCVLLFGLPLLGWAAQGVRVFEAFYRSGALVFGGGHVVLPLLQRATVAAGWVAPNDFLAGYGAAQAVPGPLFTFAAFLGWMMASPPHHWSGALLATVGIFLPGLLLVLAALPWWHALRTRPAMSAALAGVNAAVVGLLAAALYSPVWTSAVQTQADFAIASIGFLLLTRWKVPPLVVVVFCIATGVAQSVLR
ncbi:MAG TPA: chromate efflux transporter, partial [Paraburkholderia sp.]|nr:chromate efflux transporter [Paraburkholderia sp.]